ncbi:MAG: hypothetical protein ACK5O2_08270 [Microthrixaceae bacterium]
MSETPVVETPNADARTITPSGPTPNGPTPNRPTLSGTTPAGPAPSPVLGERTPATEATAGAEADSATRVFSKSVLISGIRCTLAYVVFPWILPLLGLADSVEPWVGIPISVIAIGFNIASIRRFWKSDHQWKWIITVINVSVIGLLLTLLLVDLNTLFSG